MDEQENLLFLTSLYNTWPWYYDKEAILDIHKKIILLQHRELNKLKSKKDYNKQTKIKRKKRKKEFPQQLL